MRDIETIHAELRLVATLRHAARERAGPLPSIAVADALLDERRELSACAISNAPLVQSQLVECGQEGVVCSHALLGGDWVWLAQSLSPAG